MRYSSIPLDSTFTPQARKLGIAAAWMTFIVNEVYAVVSGLAYVSQGAAVESGPFLSIMALLVVVMGRSWCSRWSQSTPMRHQTTNRTALQPSLS